MADFTSLVFVIVMLVVLTCLFGVGCFFDFHLANDGVPCGSVLVSLVVPRGVLVGVPSFWLFVPSVSFARVVPDQLMRVHVPAINEAFWWNGLITHNCAGGVLVEFQTDSISVVAVNAEYNLCVLLSVDDRQKALKILGNLRAVFV